ncbi:MULTISPECIES: acyl-CoA dehydrogenase family protein [Rhodococcus]|uniref:Acyl-CoA dehydrogenase family protein n=1 Tax=Rhodococcus oxybenzonivorans TaxID=1990687 RepID=A0AAE5A607_9NOCA|nr:MULTISPECIES: acyl-CoA dehydrogenase family protein [Rhodococcus]MDV7241721.1 acyl-CoA dehydrogenase family protein [Rhodococcus oxybenzonivorans]MDV7264668.1 acyl-CoA dehydrogenase family protein [Rhodococcus oxybenzonivorans]MDV7273745.1 acyl-CoA dehydrogenase family protein [Rhodococcus oxybenzonivorans]MDV7334003.1 acyl-CoA dehydrogenase family protein [Rhodococcus oxybenzonivorans]MDV7343422.1 acyl-CoA dehydrogenase family protein [Rhodococcus oxybenzonivorans]
MDFALSDEQQMLRDTIRELLDRHYDTEKRNKVIDTDPGWSQDVWGKFAEIGALGLSFAEDDGGLGAGPVETMTVMGEIGRRLAPEPLLDGVLVPGGLIAAVGTADQRAQLLHKIAGGRTVLAFAHLEPAVRWPTRQITTVATDSGGTWTVTGTKNPVLRGDVADSLVVSAALPAGGIGLFLVHPRAEGLHRQSYRTYDGLRAAQIEFTATPAELLGDGTDASTQIDAAVVAAQAALGAEAVGIMEEVLRLTTEYLKQRKQFGVPLAKFQTLTQRAADMYVSLELARSMSLYATMALADGTVDPVIAARAKLQIGRAARHIGQEAIQLHGGIGITAEYPVGHYVARLTAIEHTWGATDDHLRTVAAGIGDYDKVEL